MKRYTILFFVISVIIYSYAKETHNYLLEALSKPVPVLLLIFSLKPVGRYCRFILAGLVFSLFGDIALLGYFDLFMPGLVFFLTAHFLYIIAFSGRNRSMPVKSLILFLILAVMIISFLYPRLGSLKMPVAVYVLVITVMGWRAFVQRDYDNAAVYAFAGAVFFIISDFNLAVNKFVHPYHYSAVVTIITYWIAQYLIVRSAVEE